MLESEIGTLFAQIVLPLHLVHSQNIVHRDLKSQNIFLTRNLDQVKIGDFGISKILASKSQAYSLVGTPCYISPELCDGKPYNQKSDIWSLGKLEKKSFGNQGKKLGYLEKSHFITFLLLLY